MRKLLLALVIALVCLSLVVPAFAQSAPPCNDNGEAGNADYALHHIIPATAEGEHVPGTHGGFSLCLATGRSVNQP